MGESSFQPNPLRSRTTAVRPTERELVIRRTLAAPPRIVFDAWTRPELFQLWWAPRSLGMPLLSVEMDARAGGGYRVGFGRDGVEVFAAFGKYIEVTPPSRIVWTNDEGDETSVTTVTFEAQDDGQTLLTLTEVYPSKAAAEASIGMEDGMAEQFEQLDDLLVTLGASA
jgi:uncharacterized protein YndB with AHSA1/START domain